MPVGAASPPDAAALAWLPLVGIVLGALAGAAAWAVSLVAPAPFAVATAFGATLALSGAVHLDGFLDSCDALAAAVSPERRLEIMKDPRHGTYALAGLAALAAWWIAALSLLPPALLPAALAFAGGASRLTAVLNAYAIPYGRAGASARAFDARPPRAVMLGMTALVVAIAAAARAPLWIGLVPLAAVAALGLGRLCAMRLGGVLVGDCYGATIVVLDVALLAAIVLLQGH